MPADTAGVTRCGSRADSGAISIPSRRPRRGARPRRRASSISCGRSRSCVDTRPTRIAGRCRRSRSCSVPGERSAADRVDEKRVVGSLEQIDQPAAGAVGDHDDAAKRLIGDQAASGQEAGGVVAERAADADDVDHRRSISQAQEVGGARDARVVVADGGLAQARRLGGGAPEDGGRQAAQVVLHLRLVLGRRRHDAGGVDESLVVGLVGLVEHAARRLGDGASDPGPRRERRERRRRAARRRRSRAATPRSRRGSRGRGRRCRCTGWRSARRLPSPSPPRRRRPRGGRSSGSPGRAARRSTAPRPLILACRAFECGTWCSSK